jgi:multiple sugar transport system substrate-binding protein
MRKLLGMAALAAAVVTGPMVGPAMAQTEIVVQYPIPDIFKDVHEEIAKQFMAANPNIKVKFTQPTKEYEDATQQILRNAVTGQLPDVTFQGLNRQRILADRNIAQPLDGLVAAEKDWGKAGYDGALLTLGQVKGKQYGMGFSLSTPIIYFNADLVKKAGGDPDNFPKTWEGIFALAKKINDPANKIAGFHFDWDITGNWMWQALVFSNGGTMLTPDEKKVAFDGPAGQKAINTLRLMMTDGGMRDVSQATALQDFVSGRLGIWAHSTFPLGAGADSRLPAGGNVAMMLAKDPAKQKAAWEYIKFATGPVGATIMVKGTGYFPANAIPAKDAKMLGDFYTQNPNHRVAIGQLPSMTAWYAFPGENGLKITDVIKDHLQSVVNGSAKPEDALKKMTTDTQALLPK